MNAGTIIKYALYTLAVIVPGGGVAVAGYHAFMYWRKRKKKNDDVQDGAPTGESETELQGPKKCG